MIFTITLLYILGAIVTRVLLEDETFVLPRTSLYWVVPVLWPIFTTYAIAYSLFFWVRSSV